MNKSNMKETLVVICRALLLGGIETNAIVMMRNAIEKGRRVIWIGDTKKKYSSNYRDVIEGNNIEYVPYNYSQLYLYNITPVSFQDNEQISFVTFNLFDCFIAFKYRSQYINNTIKVFCIIPHFSGSNVLLEQSVVKIFQKPIKNVCRKVYKELYENDCLHFCNKVHAEVLSNNYDISFSGFEGKVLSSIDKQKFFSEEQRIAVYRDKSKFTIISAGRFEFPHKGFLLGLVNEFSILALKYPQLRMVIIGEGPDRSILEKLIASQPQAIIERISVLPSVSPEELVNIMLKCNLNVSVAGCATIGAKAGVLTLPARHYTNNCEVYGFIPESKDKTVCSDKGEPVSKYIEFAINMSEEEYVSACKNSYNAYRTEPVNLDYPFGSEQKTTYLPSVSSFLLIQIIYYIKRYVSLAHRLIQKH